MLLQIVLSALMRQWHLITIRTSPLTGALIVIDRLSNVTVGAGMVEETVGDLDADAVVTAEERAARLRSKTSCIVALASGL